MTCNLEWGRGLDRALQGQQEEAQQRTWEALAVLDGQAVQAFHPFQGVRRARPCLPHQDVTGKNLVYKKTNDIYPARQEEQAEVGQLQ
jgi:hypothetical protein